jgi:hypothetical protein
MRQRRLRVLLLEDNPGDAAIVQDALERSTEEEYA